MDALRNLSMIFLTTAKSNKDKTWEEPAKKSRSCHWLNRTCKPLSRLAASLSCPEKGTHAREAVPTAEGELQVQETTPAESIEEPPQPKRVAREVTALRITYIR